MQKLLIILLLIPALAFAQTKVISTKYEILLKSGSIVKCDSFYTHTRKELTYVAILSVDSGNMFKAAKFEIELPKKQVVYVRRNENQ